MCRYRCFRKRRPTVPDHILRTGITDNDRSIASFELHSNLQDHIAQYELFVSQVTDRIILRVEDRTVEFLDRDVTLKAVFAWLYPAATPVLDIDWIVQHHFMKRPIRHLPIHTRGRIFLHDDDI